MYKISDISSRHVLKLAIYDRPNRGLKVFNGLTDNMTCKSTSFIPKTAWCILKGLMGSKIWIFLVLCLWFDRHDDIGNLWDDFKWQQMAVNKQTCAVWPPITVGGQCDDMPIYHEYKGIDSISPLVYYVVYIEWFRMNGCYIFIWETWFWYYNLNSWSVHHVMTESCFLEFKLWLMWFLMWSWLWI